MDTLKGILGIKPTASPLPRVAIDVRTPGPGYELGGTYGDTRTFGGDITDGERLFASQREPLMTWLVSYVATDIFNDWFRVAAVDDPENDDLDELVQPVLEMLAGKKQLTRLTTFERRYGTAVLLKAYSAYEDENWLSPLEGHPAGRAILQITPYPWTKVQVLEHDTDPASLRYGLPTVYKVTTGGVSTLDVHYTRVIHDAPRLDEHPYIGQSVMDPAWDDSTGHRNLRWGQYQLWWRYGGGWPHFIFPGATKEDIDAWIASGEADKMMARGYLVSGGEGGDKAESIEFKGVQGVSLSPEPFNMMAIWQISMASRIPGDILKGVSAGAISGSEVNERAYYKFISGEQSDVEPVVRELIDSLMDTGQVAWDRVKRPYIIEWNSVFEINDLDRARIEALLASANTQKLNYMTKDELRDELGLGPYPQEGL